ncbi:hypothetical protein CEN43_00005, partial [Fischerella thermalis BR2B]
YGHCTVDNLNSSLYYATPLQEYVLVSESEIKVEVYRKNNQNNWFVEELGKEDNLQLSSVGLEIAIADIYEDVRT